MSSHENTISSYHLDNCVGKGAFSTVYRAEKNGKTVALKSIPRESLNDSEILRLVERETRLHPSLIHPNIVRVYEVLHTPTHIYIVEEFCSNGTLENALLSDPHGIHMHFLHITIGIIEGLLYLDQRQVYHRDIKPDNIFLDEEFNPKIGDFGLCIETNHLTSTICGTPYYLAPEIISGKSYDPSKSDVWALGVLFYQMSTGSIPWQSSNITKLCEEIMIGTVPYSPFMVAELRRVIQRCLVVDPKERATLQEIRQMPYFLPPKLGKAPSAPLKDYVRHNTIPHLYRPVISATPSTTKVPIRKLSAHRSGNVPILQQKHVTQFVLSSRV